MFLKRIRLHNVFGAFLVIPYVFLVTQTVFLWKQENLKGDIANYISLYDRYARYIAYRTQNWLDYITNETVFHYLYYELSKFLDDPQAALQVLSGAASLMTFFALLPRRRANMIYMILLLHPRVLDLMSSQVRFALAISIFVLLIKFSSSRLRGIYSMPLATIHTFFMAASVFVIAFDKYLSRRSTFMAYAQAVGISIALVFGAEVVLSFLGDRRADWSDINKSFGAAYLAMTVLTYIPIVYTNRNIVFHVFGFLFVVTGISAVFTSLAGGYAERYVSSSIIFLLAYSSQASVKKPIIVFPILLVNLILSSYFWLQGGF